MNQDYKKAHQAVQQEMAEIEEQRRLLDQRYARLKQTSFGLETLMEDETASRSNVMVTTLPVVGLTDACRHALKVAQSPRTAAEVRDWLEGSGYDLSDQENALASIHTILKRLVTSGEAEAGTNSAGKVSYSWKGPKWLAHVREQTRKQQRLAREAAEVAQRKSTRRELRESKEAAEAVEQMEMRKRIREFEAKKKS